MKSVILLRRRRVLWGTAMAACLLSGFLLMMSKIPVPRVAQGSHSNPAVFPFRSVSWRWRIHRAPFAMYAFGLAAC